MLENKEKSLKLKLRAGIFLVFSEILKHTKIGVVGSCIMIVVYYLHFVAIYFDKDKDFGWDDEILLSGTQEMFEILRIVPLFYKNKMVEAYYSFFAIDMCLVILMVVGLIVLYIQLTAKKSAEVLIQWLKLLVPIYWILYMPLLEGLLSILKCKNGNHYIDQNMVCGSVLHICLSIFAFLFSAVLFILGMLTSSLGHATEDRLHDAMARIMNIVDMEMHGMRSILVCFLMMTEGEVGTNIGILLSLFVLSTLTMIQYLKFVNFYNRIVSQTYGTCIISTFWLSLNGILLQFINLHGHIIILVVILPLIYYSLRELRTKLLERIVVFNIGDMREEESCLFHMTVLNNIITAQQDTMDYNSMRLVTLIHRHFLQSESLRLIDIGKLYDPSTDSYASLSYEIHQDSVFVKHWMKDRYRECFNKFNHSPMLAISFSHFMYAQFGNIHQAYLQLNVAQTRANILHHYAIYRYRRIYEEHLKNTSEKHDFQKLHQVIVFERQMVELCKAINGVCTTHLVFWTILRATKPDLHGLNMVQKQIFKQNSRCITLWESMKEINSENLDSMQFFASYLYEIRNDPKQSMTLLKKVEKIVENAVPTELSIDNRINKTTGSSNHHRMFACTTAVIHMSGNIESAGRIVDVNEGQFTIFGYKKIEIIGNSIKIMMPTIIGNEHDTFLKDYFTSGKAKLMNRKNLLFGKDRNGYSFPISIYVKQLPSLESGVQYAGMIRKSEENYEYIILDQNGVIDSCSANLANMLGIPNSSVFEQNQINIKVMAPAMIDIFVPKTKIQKRKLEEFYSVNGSYIKLYIPKYFHDVYPEKRKERDKERLSNVGYSILSTGKNNPSMNAPYQKWNMFFNKGKKPISKCHTKTFMTMPEYTKPLVKLKLKCRIIDYVIHLEKKEDLTLKVFKLEGSLLNNYESNAGSNSATDNLTDTIKRGDKEVVYGREIEEGKEEGKISGPEKTINDVSEVTKRIRAKLQEKFQRNSLSPGTKNVVHLATKQRVPVAPLRIIEEESKEPEEVMKDDLIIPPLIMEEEEVENIGKLRKKQTLASANWKRAVGAVTLDLSEKEANHEEDEAKLIHKKSAVLINKLQHVVRSAMAGHMQIQAFKPTAETTPPITYEVSKAEQLLRKSLLNAVRYNTMNFTHNNAPAKEFKDYNLDEDGMDKFDSWDDEKDDEDRSKGKHEPDKFKRDDDDDEGSVSSTSSGGTSAFMKSYYGIRAAVDDNYTPQFIKKSQWISFIVFLIFITISATNNVLLVVMGGNLEDTITSIENSEERRLDLIVLSLNANLLLLLNMNEQSNNELMSFVYKRYTKEELYMGTKANIFEITQKLDESQDDLMNKCIVISSDVYEKVNPSDVEIKEKIDNTIVMREESIWESIQLLITETLRVWDSELSQITKDDPSLFFILYNSVNGVLESLQKSTQVLVDYIKDMISETRFVYLLMFVIASAALFVAALGIIPLITKAAGNKQKVLVLFLHLSEAVVEAEITKLKEFIGHIPTNIAEGKAIEGNNMKSNNIEDSEDKEGKREYASEGSHLDTDEDDSIEEEERQLIRLESRLKHFKPMRNPFIGLFAKIFFFLILIEAYFFGVYMISSEFLTKIEELTMEMNYLSSRNADHSFLLLIELVIISLSEGEQEILGYDPINYLYQFQKQIYPIEELLLDKYAHNSKYHSSSYNSYFHDLVYESICENIESIKATRLAECNQLSEGILTKGIYASVIKYWDLLLQLIQDYLDSSRSKEDIGLFLSHPNLELAKNLDKDYIKLGINLLIERLEEEIKDSFDGEYQRSRALSICYLIFMFLIYILIWMKFLTSLQKQIYQTKRSLSIIPPEILLSTKEIKDYISANSRIPIYL